MAEDILLGIYGAAFGAVIGALVAFFLTRYELQKNEREQVTKVKNILNDDFYRIYDYATQAKEFLTSILGSKKKLEETLGWVKHEVDRARSPVVFSIPTFRFLLWDAIITSGALINLKSEEIQIINSTHDDMVSLFKRIQNEFERFDKDFSLNTKTLKKPSNTEFYNGFHFFLMGIYSDVERIQESFDSLSQKVKWIKKEYSTESASSLNEDFLDIDLPSIHKIPRQIDDLKEEKKTAI